MHNPLPPAMRALSVALLLLAVSVTFAQPKINSFSPATGPAGTAVTITGSGFNAAVAGNIVYFGAVRAAVTGASASVLTVTAPAGATYEPVSVLNAATGRTGYASKPFTLTFANPFGTLPDKSFQPKVDFNTDYAPSIVRFSDLDGDGNSDIVVGAFTGIFILRNNFIQGSITAASFATRITLPSSSLNSAVVVKDVDGDGKPDVVAASGYNNTVSVWRNISATGSLTLSSFAAPVSFSTGSANPSNNLSLAIDDIDVDGRPELVVGNLSSGTVSVFRNLSVPGAINTSSFAARVDFTTAGSPTNVAISDLDGDGKPDLITANQDYGTIAPGTVSVLRNTSATGTIDANSFAAHVEFATQNNPVSVTASDIDGDGKPDLVAANSRSGSISVLRNTASVGSINASSFSPKVDFAISPSSLSVGDVSGDGKPDIVTAGSGNVSILRNTASTGSITTSSFASKTDFSAAEASGNVSALGDLDGDGIPEAGFANSSSYSISVLKIYATPTATASPQVVSFSPLNGPVGITVNITGSNFNTTPGKNLVYFGAVRAEVTGGSSANLTVKVPAGATYQPFSVLDSATGLTGYSSRPFNTTFTNPFGTGIPANFYRQGVNFPVGTTSSAIAISDLDGDRKPDLVVTNFYNGNTVTVLHNKSATGTVDAASFEAPVLFSATPVNSSIKGPVDVATGDLDGDGKPEIVVTHYGSGTVQIFHNRSAASVINSTSFEAPVTFSLGGNPPGFVAISDLDGDGKPELIAGITGASSISVFVNTTTRGNINPASFSTRIDLPVASPASAVTVRDVDQDGKPDIIAAISGNTGVTGSGLVTVFRNTATPGSLSSTSFATRVDLPAADHPVSVAVADFDGDGRQDIAYGSNTRLDIFQNTGTPGSITTASFSNVPVAATSYASFIAVDDLDGDGKPDIAGTGKNGSLPDLLVLRNVSVPGTLTASSFTSTTLTTGSAFNSLAIGDLDGDGIPELVPINLSSGVTVLKINVPSTLQPPTVTGFSPTIGAVGTVVTITGTNFNAIPDNNVVYFGAVRAAVTGGSVTSLTVVVPSGGTNQPFSVLNTATGLTGYAARPFNTTFNNPFGFAAIPDNFFKPKINFITGTLPYSVALGDLNGDGKPEMVVVNENANTISILRNTSSPGNSSFDAKVDLPVGTDPRAVVIGDVNGDGLPDIVVANAGSSTVSVLRTLASTPGGPVTASSFAPRIDFAAGSTPYSVAIGDLDGNGKPDLVVANLMAGTVSVLQNTGTPGAIYPPSFAAPVSFAAGTYPRFVAVSDLDGDRKIDIAVVNERSNTVSAFHNTTTTGNIDASSFAPMISFATGSNPNNLAIGDIDVDGKPDLVVTNFASNTVSVLRNTSTAGNLNAGSFASKADFATGSQPFYVVIGNINGDGLPDIATVNAVSNNISVLRNQSVPGNITTGTFAGKVDFATGNYPVSIALGDLDGSGIPEIIAADAGSNRVSILTINVAQPPAVTSVNPVSGPAGSTVTITGANFNPAAASNQVYFGAVKAQITDGTSGSLTVTVPAGATYQPVTVLNSANGLIGYSSLPFVTTFTNPLGNGIPANFYRPKVDFSTGSSSFLYAVAFGDLDGDGKPDMVGVNKLFQTISVLRNISPAGSITASSFAAPLVIPTTTNPQSVVLADIDGDGKLDIVTANPDNSSFSILCNMASPGTLTAASFAAQTNFSAGQYISSLAVGDLDLDGKSDIVATNLYSGTVSVFRNTTNTGVVNASSFAAGVSSPAGNFPRFVVIRDMDGDGKPDLVVANERSNNVSVLRNTAVPGGFVPSSFATKADFAAGSSPSGVAVGDVDQDGKPDIAVVNYGSNTVSVLQNRSVLGTVNAGSFASKIDFGVGGQPLFVTIGDADGDGLADLVTANSASNNVSVLHNAGTANGVTAQSFAPVVYFGTSGYPLWVALGDLDGDGIAELATANAANATISVLKAGAPFQTIAQATSPASQAAADVASAGTLQAYPNPTSGNFTLQLQSMKGSAANVEVFSENGKPVERRVINTGSKAARFVLRLSLRNQPAGVYYVKVTTINGVQIAKVVVQR